MSRRRLAIEADMRFSAPRRSGRALRPNRAHRSPAHDLLVRLVAGWELTRRRQIEFPVDLQPFVASPDAGQDVGNHRVQHRNDAPSDQQWVSVSV